MEVGYMLINKSLVYNRCMSKKFKPFEHDNLELKNELIDYARSISGKNDIESQLACAMIYANFAEYMAWHLLETMRHYMYASTYNAYAGLLFTDQRTKEDDRPKTFGHLVGELEGYGFPDKEELIATFRQISKLRNNLFHNFAKLNRRTFKKVFSEDINSIKELTEEVFAKINTIYTGLQKILVQDTEENHEQETIQETN